jgi:hypothetical protein
VQEAAVSTLASWENFYVIVGSSAAALTGLMFVVVALVKETDLPTAPGTIAAFGTPTVVHLCTAFLIAAAASAPWHRLTSAAAFIGSVGLAGVVYTCIVVRRTHRQTGYTPVLEDWIWHVLLPFASYTALLIGGIALPLRPGPALFAVAAALIMLVFIGIHNSWDTVTYITGRRWDEANKPKE